MKISKQHRQEIIDGLLPLLKQLTEPRNYTKEVEGSTLINTYNIRKDLKGKPIHPGTKYLIEETEQVKVDHLKKLRQVIDRATNLEGMNEDLARYLVKYGKSKQLITDSLPEHLRTKNQ